MAARAAITLLILLALPAKCLADFDYYTSSRAITTVFCESAKSLGGGVVISRTDIISMSHVVSPCRQVIIGYYDGTHTIGAVTDIDDTRDLARIRPEQVPDLVSPAQLDVDTPDIDAKLHAITHLNGMPWTYSPASLTYPHERLIPLDGKQFSLLIVNTPAFAGSSGGALFNDDGRVVGFAKGVLTGTSISYFVPSGAVCKHLIKCKTSKWWTNDD